MSRIAERVSLIQAGFDNAHHYRRQAESADSPATARVLSAIADSVTDRSWRDIFDLLSEVPAISTETAEDGRVTVTVLGL